MKFKFLIFVLAFFIFPLVSAYNVEVTLNSNIEDFNTLIYKCSDSTCAQTSFYELINSGTNVNKYSLIGSGDNYYAEFDYKTCFAPHIYINHVWDPYKSNEVLSIFFSKKISCKGVINSGSLSQYEIKLGEGVLIKSGVDSAFTYPTGIPRTLSIPNSVKDEYSSKTKVEFYANDILIHSTEEEILIESNEYFEFNWKPNNAGSYEIKVKTLVTDCACLSSNNQEKIIGTLIVNGPQCIPNIIFTPWTSWQNITQCRPDNTLVQERSRVEYDAKNCGTFSNLTHTESRIVSCVPTCVENRVFTSWTSWQNITQCRIDNTTLQKRTRTEYDAKNCGTFQNITHEEFKTISCVYQDPQCTPNIIFTSWTSWQNVTQCRPDNTTLQKRTRTEYDAKNCGTFTNVTHEEFKTISCIYKGEEDETAPSSITNLHVIDKSYTWILWGWTNPNQTDFYQNIIYIDGINVANTSNNYYNATGLNPNTYYTITVHTKDYSGNINDTDVSNAARTLKEKEEEEEKKKKDKKTIIEEAPIFFLGHNLTEIENVTIRLGSFSKGEEEVSLNWLWLLLLILAILIILVLIIYVAYSF